MRTEKINELQERIKVLSKSIDLFQTELHSLQRELDDLRNNAAETESERVSNTIGDERVGPGNTGLENYIGLRFMHIIGIIVLVTGLSIGVKYAIDRQLISEGMRIVLAYAAGIILLILSLRLKKKYLVFSAILFSGSMASAYFTTYAAFVYYHFFPMAFAFAAMTALTIYTAVSAISYNRQEIAILGMIGAYGIPFLISANAEKVDLFFSYILLINIGVAFISFKKYWKWMQWLALFITWTLFIGWELMRYESSLRWLGFLFMAAYYALFFASAIATRISGSSLLERGVVQQIVINNIALYLAAVLIFGGFEYNLDITTGFSALILGALGLGFYILFPSEFLLQRMVAWQSIILLVMFIGFRWDGLTVTLLWIAVAVLLFAWGIVYKKSWPRLASILLIGTTLGKLIIFDSDHFTTVQKIVSFLVIGVLLLLFSFYYQKYHMNRES